MEAQQSPKIPFYVQRPFGEKMNASFDFIKENWKVMLKYITYLILPVCLVQALSMNSFMGYYMGAIMGGTSYDDLGTGILTSYGFTALFGIIGSLLFSSLLFALIKLYNDREERLVGITFADIKPLFFRNMGRLFLMGLLFLVLYVLAAIIVVLLAFGSLLTLILTIPAIIAVVIALMMWTPIYLFEDISLGASLSKAFRMGFATWGGVFGILFIMGIVASILQGVLMTPWYVVVVVKSLFAYSEGTVSEPSIIYNILSYILGVVMVYGMYLSMVFIFLGISYQYAHASEKLDSITVETEIDNFENL